MCGDARDAGAVRNFFSQFGPVVEVRERDANATREGDDEDSTSRDLGGRVFHSWALFAVHDSS